MKEPNEGAEGGGNHLADQRRVELLLLVELIKRLGQNYVKVIEEFGVVLLERPGELGQGANGLNLGKQVVGPTKVAPKVLF